MSRLISETIGKYYVIKENMSIIITSKKQLVKNKIVKNNLHYYLNQTLSNSDLVVYYYE